MATNSKTRAKIAAKKKAEDEIQLPSWEGQEGWDAETYRKAVNDSLRYYNLNFAGKDLKPKVVEWMKKSGYKAAEIKAFKATHDWRVTSTHGATAANLLNGMPASRKDYNDGKNVESWLRDRVAEIIAAGAKDNPPKKAEKKNGAEPKVLSVQDRLRIKAGDMSAELDYAFDELISDPKKYDVKKFDPLKILRAKECKAAHARIIASFYEKDLEEIEEVLVTKDKDLLEAYEHLTKTEKKKVQTFLSEIVGACTMLQQEGKVTRATRKKKPKSKDKLVAKLNYCVSDEDLKLVSIKPADIIGANELWVYNRKTRKIGKYVAAAPDPKNLGREGTGLSVKGTTIIGYDEKASIQKTLRKPKEQLPEWKKLGKVKLRKYLDEIKAVDIKLNGRVNPDVILLKAD